MLDKVVEDPTFMKCIITGDESWIYEYYVKSVQPSSEWRPKNERRPKKSKKAHCLYWLRSPFLNAIR